MKALPPITAPAELAAARENVATIRQRRAALPAAQARAQVAVDAAIASDRLAEQTAVQVRARALADGNDAGAAGQKADKALAAARERRIAADADLAAWGKADLLLAQDLRIGRQLL